jgi:ribose transport system ATP-binding protein
MHSDTLSAVFSSGVEDCGVTPALGLRSVSKAFPGVVALKHATLNMPHGKVVGLVGANGAGKSTLVKVLSGEYPDHTGTILRKGSPIALRSPEDAQRAGIAIVPQEPAIAPELTIAQNVFLGLERRCCNSYGLIDIAEMNRACAEMLDDFRAGIAPGCRTGALSRNQLQIVQIVKALAANPSVLVLDEPTMALTQVQSEILKHKVHESACKGTSILFISHHLEEVLSWVDCVTVLRDGEVVFDAQAADTSVAELKDRMFGPLTTHSWNNHMATAVGNEVISFESAATEHFSDLTFSLSEGEIVGLIAPTVEPASELLRAIYGAEPFLSGTIRIRGSCAAVASPGEAMAQGICYLSENRRADGIFSALSVAENIVMLVLERFSRWGRIDRAAMLRVAEVEGSRFLVQGAHLEEPIAFLSGGNQQKSLLARLLLPNPDILLLEEPFGGIDIRAKEDLVKLLAEFRSAGKAVLISSTEPDELLRVCNRLIFILHGRICRTTTNQTVSRDQIVAHLTGTASCD